MRHVKRSYVKGAAAFAALAAALPAAQADAWRALETRAGALALDERCGGLAPGSARALAVGAVQAEGALLRADVDARVIQASLAAVRADTAGRACADELAEFQSIDDAGRAWLRTSQMRFPVGETAWAADRAPQRYGQPGWMVRQDLSPSQNHPGPVFGVVRTAEGDRRLAVEIIAGAPVQAVRLRVRDRAATSGPAPAWLQRLSSSADLAWPDSMTQTFWAADRVCFDPAHRCVFAFTPEALDAVLALQPNDIARIEADLRAQSRPVTHTAHVGDVAAALAFADPDAPMPQIGAAAARALSAASQQTIKPR